MKSLLLIFSIIYIIGCSSDFMNNPPLPEEKQIHATIVYVSEPESSRQITVEWRRDNAGTYYYTFSRKSSDSLNNPRAGDCIKIWLIKGPVAE